MPPEQMAQMIGLLGSGLIVSIIVLFVAVAAWRGIDVYESFVEGAKEGFGVAVQIIPYLIAMLVAISVFRTTGCMDYVIGGIRSVVLAFGLNDDFVPALPVGLMKTFSGSGARGLMVDVMTTYGVDSFQGKLAAIIQGSTETTFYVLAVYFGSVNITKTRYALACGLIADAVGLVGADPDRLRLFSLKRGLTERQFPARIAPLRQRTKHVSIPGCRSLGGEIGRHAILRG
jgi:spore maturation protein SpmB